MELYTQRYIEDKLNMTNKFSNIEEVILYIWNNKDNKDNKDNQKYQQFVQQINNQPLMNYSGKTGNTAKTGNTSKHTQQHTCKLNIHISEYTYFLNKMIEQIIRNPQKRIQILTNSFQTYNKENPYIVNEHEIIFTNDDINKLLKSSATHYELSQFVNDIHFFDISYLNQLYSKESLNNHINTYNDLDIYNKHIVIETANDTNINDTNISANKNTHFDYIKSAKNTKSTNKYLPRSGNQLSFKKLAELNKNIQLINKRGNIRFLKSTVHKNIIFELAN
jgi:hypothetical protein